VVIDLQHAGAGEPGSIVNITVGATELARPVGTCSARLQQAD
jgi:hypothetical protein